MGEERPRKEAPQGSWAVPRSSDHVASGPQCRGSFQSYTIRHPKDRDAGTNRGIHSYSLPRPHPEADGGWKGLRVGGSRPEDVQDAEPEMTAGPIRQSVVPELVPQREATGRACPQEGWPWVWGSLRQRGAICERVQSSDSPQKLRQEDRMRNKHTVWTIKLRKLPRKQTKLMKS